MPDSATVARESGELRFNGRVAIVTGGGRGIGRAHALMLAARGASLVVNDNGTSVDGTGAGRQPAENVAAEARAAGAEAISDSSDVSSQLGAAALVDGAIERFGRIDIVINNAGIVRRLPLGEVTPTDIQKHLDVHLFGSFNVTQAAWPHMLKARYGRVIMTASSAIFGDAFVLPYSTAKAAILGLARSFALAGEESGIRVNTLVPTALTRMAGSPDHEEDRTGRSDLSPEHCASVAAFLAHDRCDVTGEIYSVGGGRAARCFIGVSRGYVAPDLSPESVASHWDEIRDVTAPLIPISMMGYVAARAAIIAEAGKS